MGFRKDEKEIFLASWTDLKRFRIGAGSWLL